MPDNEPSPEDVARGLNESCHATLIRMAKSRKAEFLSEDERRFLKAAGLVTYRGFEHWYTANDRGREVAALLKAQSK